MKSEKSLQNYLKLGLEALDCLVYKFASPNKRGVPDLIVITPGGRVLFVEMKSPTGKGRLSELQKHEIAELKSHKMDVYIIGTVEDADRLIYALDYCLDGSRKT